MLSSTGVDTGPRPGKFSVPGVESYYEFKGPRLRLQGPGPRAPGDPVPNDDPISLAVNCETGFCGLKNLLLLFQSLEYLKKSCISSSTR